ncbi:WYL domain-containing protein [Streptobacillus canis]|uniref:WYL domain-containing protein n=1 Tax=Streptobacillus canis TaxID=2678686 RepID=UPI0012E2D172|nr:WYL domain-containing protein [Streptobacillus canis]
MKIVERRTLTLSRDIYEKFSEDQRMFNLGINEIINRVLTIYLDDISPILKQYLDKIEVVREKEIGINPKYKIRNGRTTYSLKKNTKEIIKKYLNENNKGIEDLSDIILETFKKFYSFERYERERLLNFDMFLKIKEKILTDKFIKCRYNKEGEIHDEIIIPIDMKVGIKEGRNYLVSYRKEVKGNQDHYFNIKFSEILNFEETFEDIIDLDKEEVMDILDNFDETLSWIKKDVPVTVKFTEKGLELFENVIHSYKPRLSERNINENILTRNVIANKFLTEKYFAPYYEHATIVSPSYIREDIMKRLEKMCKNYGIIK